MRERFHFAVGNAALFVEEPAHLLKQRNMLVMWMRSMRALRLYAAAYDVDFFGVHEEALIEAADFRKGRHAEEQDAAEQIVALERLVVADACKEVASHTRGGEGRRPQGSPALWRTAGPASRVPLSRP